MSLILQAGDAAGDRYPDGTAITDVFGTEDRAAAVYLAALYQRPGVVVQVVDLDKVDMDDDGAVTEDDLTGEDAARFEALAAIAWTESHEYACGFVGDIEVEVDGIDAPYYTARINGVRVFRGDDQTQVMARVAVAALDTLKAA